MRLAQQDHLPLYGIAYKDKPDDFAPPAGQLGDPYRAGRPRPGRPRRSGFRRLWRAGDLCDRQRPARIRKRFVGPLTAETVEKELLPLLKQLEPPS